MSEMKKVELYVKTGELVATKEIPPFEPLPDVLIWGSRVFQRVTTYSPNRAGNEYVEAFAFWIVDGEEEGNSST